MIVVDKNRTTNCSYSSYGCNWYITGTNTLYCNDLVIECFDNKKDAIECLDNIRQAWLNGCDVYFIEDNDKEVDEECTE